MGKKSKKKKTYICYLVFFSFINLESQPIAFDLLPSYNIQTYTCTANVEAPNEFRRFIERKKKCKYNIISQCFEFINIICESIDKAVTPLAHATPFRNSILISTPCTNYFLNSII